MKRQPPFIDPPQNIWRLNIELRDLPAQKMAEALEAFATALRLKKITHEPTTKPVTRGFIHRGTMVGSWRVK